MITGMKELLPKIKSNKEYNYQFMKNEDREIHAHEPMNTNQTKIQTLSFRFMKNRKHNELNNEIQAIEKEISEL